MPTLDETAPTSLTQPFPSNSLWQSRRRIGVKLQFGTAALFISLVATLLSGWILYSDQGVADLEQEHRIAGKVFPWAIWILVASLLVVVALSLGHLV